MHGALFLGRCDLALPQLLVYLVADTVTFGTMLTAAT